MLEEPGVSLLGFGSVMVVMMPSRARKGRLSCLLCSDWIKVAEDALPKQRAEEQNNPEDGSSIGDQSIQHLTNSNQANPSISITSKTKKGIKPRMKDLIAMTKSNK